ncbi:TetR family transcriptional regulator [Paenibacillus selenitireducens]|uniref:TetR family transcriptional regulator n=1 Tax=Paenibacillus selenitireducens TaxID=1324314 RepID=A0A1T2X188_9BACL|nr:TetR/AcrR family transcriptional regulator [Paenibacillus selenitireducens]OPA73601.1 TetR family transcriptional regulator [Paenibacillus selenitireducens]
MSTSGRPREFKDVAVIDAAIDLFWSKGYEACSTQELCDRTGLGRGSLYNAFGSKHELYEQALQRYHELGIEAQLEILERPVSAKERLTGLLEWAIDIDFSHPDRRGCLVLNAAMERAGIDPVVERVIGRHIGFLEQALCRLMEDGLRTGEIRADRPALELARLFMSSYHGLRFLNKSTQNREMAMHIVEATLAAIF